MFDNYIILVTWYKSRSCWSFSSESWSKSPEDIIFNNLANATCWQQIKGNKIEITAGFKFDDHLYKYWTMLVSQHLALGCTHCQTLTTETVVNLVWSWWRKMCRRSCSIPGFVFQSVLRYILCPTGGGHTPKHDRKSRRRKIAPPRYNNGDVVGCPCVFVDTFLSIKINLYRDCYSKFNNVKTHR